MNRLWTGLAIGLARWWTRVYTVGIPGRFAEVRRAEIEADLWEFERDIQPTAHGAASAWARLMLGVPDDLRWRLAQGVTARAVWWSGSVVISVLVSIVWLVSSTQVRDLPPPPVPAPFADESPRLPPPPPPPPPPPRPRAGTPSG